MRKFITSSVLFVMLILGVNAQTSIGEDIRFYTKVTSQNKDGKAGEPVIVSIDKDFKMVVTLPSKSGALYSYKVAVETILQDISSLDINGTSRHTKEVSTNYDYNVTLSDEVGCLYSLEGEKSFTVKVEELDQVSFTVKMTKNGDSKPLEITITPDDSEKAMAAWSEFAKHYSSTIQENVNNAIGFKRDSYIKNGKELFVFTDDFELENFSDDIRETYSKFCNATDISNNGFAAGEDKSEAVLTPSSFISIGNHLLTLNDSLKITADKSIVDEINCKDGFLHIVKDYAKKISEQTRSEAKKEFVNSTLSLLKILDGALGYNNQDINIVVTFPTVVPTAINDITTNSDAKSSGIYTLNGLCVSDMSKHGIYIVNGKKVVK